MRTQALIVLVIVISALTDSYAAVLCSRRSGTIKLREACRPSETQVDPVALGLQGPPGPQGEQGPPGVGFVARDANGAFVGTVAATEITGGLLRQLATKVVRLVGTRAVEFVVTEAGFSELQERFLEFENADCTGAPSFEEDNWLQAPLVSKALVVDGTTAYYPTGPVIPGLAGTSQLRITDYTTTSCAADGGMFIPPDACCVAGSGGGTGNVPAAVLDLTTLGLVPPFHVDGP